MPDRWIQRAAKKMKEKGTVEIKPLPSSALSPLLNR